LTTTFLTSAELHSHYVSEIADELRSSGHVEDVADSCDALKQESLRITELLEKNSRLSFVRLGDMELTLLLALQEGRLPEAFNPRTVKADGTKSSGSPGLAATHINRLKNAYENAGYVDFNQRLKIISTLLPKLKLCRSNGLYSNPSKSTSYVLPQWTQQEFRTFCQSETRRIGIASAESALLEWLTNQSQFHEHTGNIWPKEKEFSFHTVREGGSNLSTNLDLIKEDLKHFVIENRLTTLFLSLGGGAKILCHELSDELGIQTIDFGAMVRSLCDLGSDGQSATRSTHSILLYRLPCSLVIEGILQCFSELPTHELLAKIHAQLIHQLLPDVYGQSLGSNEYLGKVISRKRFSRALKQSSKMRAELSQESDEAALERTRFLHFCGQRGLTTSGIAYLKWFQLKQSVQDFFGKRRKPTRI